MSDDQKKYIKKEKRNKKVVLYTQLLIFVLFILIWQFLADKEYINSFITSSPKEIVKTLINLYNTNNIFFHIWITIKETIISFLITTILSILISILLYNNKFISKVLDPYLIILN